MSDATFSYLSLPNGEFSVVKWSNTYATLCVDNEKMEHQPHALAVDKSQLGGLIELLLAVHNEMED